MNFPLIYCNGCSYSDENYLPKTKQTIMKQNVYVNRVQEHIGSGFVLNRAIVRSSNRRIIRSSLHDLYHQRQINSKQKIIALIQLTFDLRGELWHESKKNNSSPVESNFITHQFTDRQDWKERLLNGADISTTRYQSQIMENPFFKKYSEGRAFFYSPYQERINLLADLVMFTNVCNNLNVEYLIFQGPKAERLEEEYLIHFFKSLLPVDNVMDLESFGFIDWCFEQNKFLPLDDDDPPEVGHYGPDAHRAFADTIIIPQLQKLKII